QFSALIALFVFAQLLGLMNSHWLLTFLYIGGQIPMNTYLMKGYIDSIPIELDEGARIDGASNTKIFMQIIMPLSSPMIAVVAVNALIIPHADLVLLSTLLIPPHCHSLPNGLYILVYFVMWLI